MLNMLIICNYVGFTCSSWLLQCDNETGGTCWPERSLPMPSESTARKPRNCYQESCRENDGQWAISEAVTSFVSLLYFPNGTTRKDGSIFLTDYSSFELRHDTHLWWHSAWFSGLSGTVSPLLSKFNGDKFLSVDSQLCRHDFTSKYFTCEEVNRITT